MEKINKQTLSQIIKEEFERALLKKKLQNHLKALNEEISSLEEVEVGDESMDGQMTPEFDLKGTHIVETSLDEAMNMEKQMHLKGNDIYFVDQKIGKIENDKVVLDPIYKDKIKVTPELEVKIKSLQTAPIAECDSAPNETEFEVVGENPTEEKWMFEGKNRMLKLGGLLKETEE